MGTTDRQSLLLISLSRSNCSTSLSPLGTQLHRCPGLSGSDGCSFSSSRNFVSHGCLSLIPLLICVLIYSSLLLSLFPFLSGWEGDLLLSAHSLLAHLGGRGVSEDRVHAVFLLSYPCSDDGGDSRRDLAAGLDSKEYCLSDRDIVEVVRTEYVYTRPPPWSDTLPTIHVITPTYSRPVQKAELTRLANTLLHVPNLHWILVEDSQRRTPLITRLLRDTGLNYTHLNVETPRNYKLRGDMRDPRIPRGTMQRNLALRWLRETFNKNNSQPGIVYFADDDNTYSLELFEEVRTCWRSPSQLISVCGLRKLLVYILSRALDQSYVQWSHCSCPECFWAGDL